MKTLTEKIKTLAENELKGEWREGPEWIGQRKDDLEVWHEIAAENLEAYTNLDDEEYDAWAIARAREINTHYKTKARELKAEMRAALKRVLA